MYTPAGPARSAPAVVDGPALVLWVDTLGLVERATTPGAAVEGAKSGALPGGRLSVLLGRRSAARPFGRSEPGDGSASDRRWRQFPDFVIIGAQRAGTTSLSQWIMAHPRTRPARTCELHYFDLNFDGGPALVSGQLPPPARGGQVTGESTPYMLFHPAGPASGRYAVFLPPPASWCSSASRSSGPSPSTG